MLSLSSTRNFFVAALVLGSLFIMTKARGAEIDFINPERAVIRNHMMPQNFNRNNRTVANDQWRMRNSVYRDDTRMGWANPLTTIFRDTGAALRGTSTYSAPAANYYSAPAYRSSAPIYTSSAPTVVYQNPASMDNSASRHGSYYSPNHGAYNTTSYQEIRNHMMPENFNRNDRAMDNRDWVNHNVVVR